MKKTFLALGFAAAALMVAGCSSGEGDKSLDTAAPPPSADANPNPPTKDPSVRPPAPPAVGGGPAAGG